jgi:predicted unusual protein kinase regulating ubiquinone biosynthesis (AarF/ABC1/UbiB family)
MLRTDDGKLCILDFGLMTEITDDQKYGMIEAIAHLINRDYTEIGQDFKNLDFIPQDTDTTPIVVSGRHASSRGRDDNMTNDLTILFPTAGFDESV